MYDATLIYWAEKQIL